jgi:flagellar assembly protein FliH
MAAAQLAEENASLRAQIADLRSSIPQIRRQIIEESEGELVRLALAIADRVVARELESDPNLVVAWAKEALEQLAVEDHVVIAVARDVAKTVPSDAWRNVGTEHKRQTDPQLAPGSVEIRTPEGTVATGAAARLAAVADALAVPTS